LVFGKKQIDQKRIEIDRQPACLPTKSPQWQIFPLGLSRMPHGRSARVEQERKTNWKLYSEYLADIPQVTRANTPISHTTQHTKIKPNTLPLYSKEHSAQPGMF
jgi:hypothetical protein